MSSSPSQDRDAALLALVLEKPESQRQAFLRTLCGPDEALRERLQRMLGARSQPGAAGDDVPTRHDAGSGAERGAEVALDDESVGRMLGRYKLLEKVGEGGCGVVYVAEQTEPVRRRVAVKVIKLGMDTKAVVARFEAERQALAMMDHPNIAKVLDAGTTDVGRPFFVMELVRGIRITDFCDRNKFTTRQRLELFIKVCQAIQHAHQKGIIHRDIKPSNILVTLHDGVPVPKVIDFGIAKATEGRLTEATVYTQLNQFIGTPAYMSPEQAEMSGLDIDTRSDIYSLGVLLYELLTGRTPFDAQELMSKGLDAMRRTIREQEPSRPSTRLATLQGEDLTTTAERRSADTARLLHQMKGDLDWIVMKCLEKDRTRRYETANALAADLGRHLVNQPVEARPPSAWYRFEKAFRRNRVAFGAAAAVFAALAGGLALSLWQYAGKSRAEQVQVQLREQAEAKAREADLAKAESSRQRDLARESLYDSLVREAGSIRRARALGYRREAFQRLQQAHALGLTNRELAVLRREASSCFGDWVGLDPVDLPDPAPSWAQALTADGLLAAIPSDGGVSLRETRTGRQVALLAHAGSPVSLSFDRQGVALYVAAFDDALEWGTRPAKWHLEKWLLQADATWRKDWSRPVPGAVLLLPTAEGPLVLQVGPEDSHVALLSPELDREICRVPLETRMAWMPVAGLSRDGRTLGFFSVEPGRVFDARLEVWDLETRRRKADIRPRLGPAFGLSFSPDGRALSATYDNTLVVYDAARWSASLSLGGSFEGSRGAAIGGQAGLLAIPSLQEFAIRLVQLQSGSEAAYLKLPGSPIACRFSDDGSVLLVTHSQGARVLHLRTDRERLRLEGHEGGVSAVEFSPDGRRLVSAGKDRTLRVWNLANPGRNRVIGRLPAPGQTLAFLPDGRFVFCGYYNTNQLSLWSVDEGVAIWEGSPANPDGVSGATAGTTWALAIAPDGRYLAAIGGVLRVWELPPAPEGGADGAWKPRLFLVDSNATAGVQFDARSNRVFYGSVGRSEGVDGVEVMQLWVRDLQPLGSPRRLRSDVHMNYVQTFSVLPRSGRVAYMSRNRSIVVVDPESGRVQDEFPIRNPSDASSWYVGNLRVSPDESRYAHLTASGLGVEIRDGATGKFLYALPEEKGSIWWLAWSPDSRKLAVSRATGEIAVWNLDEIEAQLASLGFAP